MTSVIHSIPKIENTDHCQECGTELVGRREFVVTHADHDGEPVEELATWQECPNEDCEAFKQAIDCTI